MKTKLLLFTTIVSLNVMAQIPTDSLVGYYPFTGNSNDYSGKANNGTVNGATLTTDRFDNKNSAYSFNNNDTITISDNKLLQFNTNLQSISFWIKISKIPSPPQIQPIIEKYNQYLNIESNGNAGKGFVVQFDNSGNLHYSFKNGVGSNWGDCIIPYNKIILNQYNHIVFTNDNDSLRGYVNCNKVVSNKITSGTVIGSNNVSLLIGNSRQTYGGNPVSKFVGDLDDIRFYNTTLDLNQICYLKYESPCTNKITIYDTTHITVTDTLIFNVFLTGISAPNNANTIVVYSNPTQNNLTVNFGNYSSMIGYIIKINNSLGQPVYTNNITQQSSNIDLTTWTRGTYFINIVDNNNTTISIKTLILQ